MPEIRKRLSSLPANRHKNIRKPL